MQGYIDVGCSQVRITWDCAAQLQVMLLRYHAGGPHTGSRCCKKFHALKQQGVRVHLMQYSTCAASKVRARNDSKIRHARWCPRVISWLMITVSHFTVLLSTITGSYLSHKPTWLTRVLPWDLRRQQKHLHTSSYVLCRCIYLYIHCSTNWYWYVVIYTHSSKRFLIGYTFGKYWFILEADNTMVDGKPNGQYRWIIINSNDQQAYKIIGYYYNYQR